MTATIRNGWVRYRGTTNADWVSQNPVVPLRALAVSEDTHAVKIGDGITRWADLPFLGAVGAEDAIAAAIADLVAGAPGALDTLNELAAALGDDPNLATTLTGLISTEATARADADTAVAAAAAADATTKANAAQAAAIAASQPVDSDLTAIAALSTTAFGRSLLALADAAAGRTALGLGTAATAAATAFDAAGAAAAAQAASQPVDSDLTAIAALSTTSYGRAFLALADAAAGRTALGLGTAATTDSTAYAPVATPGAVARYISGAWVAPAAAHPWLWLVGVSDPTPQASDGLGGGDEILYVARPDVADMMKLPMVGQDPSCSLTVAQGLAQPSSGDLALMYWSPYKSESYTKVRFGVGSTASSGLTIGLLGIWTSNDAGDLLALVASSANNMSMFASASQLFDVPLQASFTPTLGQRYALGVLQSGTTVGRLTAITYQGGVIGGTPAIVDSDTRRINGKIAGRSSLPSSADHSSLVTFNYQIWFRLLP